PLAYQAHAPPNPLAAPMTLHVARLTIDGLHRTIAITVAAITVVALSAWSVSGDQPIKSQIGLASSPIALSVPDLNAVNSAVVTGQVNGSCLTTSGDSITNRDIR